MRVVSFQEEEIWKELKMEDFTSKSKYVISNLGRIKSYALDKKEGRILKSHIVDGYLAISFRMNTGKSSIRYIHKLLAQHFLTKQTPDQEKVIHLDFNKANIALKNLKWVNKQELYEHLAQNPNRKTNLGQRNYTKLSETQVIRLKKRIFDPKRKTRLKLLAKQFGISEMQLYRIKRGENWANVGLNPLSINEMQISI